MNNKEVQSIITRYLLLVLLALGNLWIFYKIFTPLTIYPVFFIVKKVFEDAFIIMSPAIPSIFFKGYVAQIIPACVAGSAYYLILILNLTTPMKLNKRLASLSFLIVSFLLINIARISIFAIIVPIGYEYFDVTHQLTWYFGSTFMLVLIWLVNVYIFKIKEIPVYTDLKKLYLDAIKPKFRKNGN